MTLNNGKGGWRVWLGWGFAVGVAAFPWTWRGRWWRWGGVVKYRGESRFECFWELRVVCFFVGRRWERAEL